MPVSMQVSNDSDNAYEDEDDTIDASQSSQVLGTSFEVSNSGTIHLSIEVGASPYLELNTASQQIPSTIDETHLGSDISHLTPAATLSCSPSKGLQSDANSAINHVTSSLPAQPASSSGLPFDSAVQQPMHPRSMHQTLHNTTRALDLETPLTAEQSWQDAHSFQSVPQRPPANHRYGSTSMFSPTSDGHSFRDQTSDTNDTQHGVLSSPPTACQSSCAPQSFDASQQPGHTLLPPNQRVAFASGRPPYDSPSTSVDMRTYSPDVGHDETVSSGMGGAHHRHESPDGARFGGIGRESLQGALKDARKELDEVYSRMLIVQQERDVAEERTASHFEGRLRRKSREVQQLRDQVHRLEHSGVRGQVSDAAPGDLITLTQDQLTYLQREIVEQEQLIQGFQEENEAAEKKIKKLEGELRRQDAARAGELMNMEREIMRASEHHHDRNAETASKLRRVLELEGQLQSLKETTEQRESELRHTIETLRKEKQALEGHLAGVDFEAIKLSDTLVDEVRSEMQALRRQHDDQLAVLNQKLQWYVNNQSYLTDNDALIAEQSATINELRNRLQAGGGATSTKVADLQAQVRELQHALEKNPNSVAVLVREGAAPMRAQAVESEALKNEVDELKGKLESVAESAEKRVRTLMQQHEKVKADHALRIEVAERDAKRNATSRTKELERQLEEVRSHYQKKVKSLQSQLTAAETKRQDYKGTPKGAFVQGLPNDGRGSSGRSRSSGGGGQQPCSTSNDDRVPQAFEAKPRISREGEELEGTDNAPRKSIESMSTAAARVQAVRLRQQLTEVMRSAQAKDAVIDHLQAQLDLIPEHARTSEMVAVTSMSAGARSMNAKDEAYKELRLEADQIARENSNIQNQLHAAQQTISEMSHNQVGDRGNAELLVNEARQQVFQMSARLEASQMMVATLQQASIASTETLAELRAHHASDLKRLTQLHESMQLSSCREAVATESQRLVMKCALLERDVARSQERIRSLEVELECIRRDKVWTPAARELVSLESQVRGLAEQLTSQEQQWSHFFQAAMQAQMQTANSSPKQALPSPAPSATDQSAVLRYLQAEVDGVIECARSLQQQQVQSQQFTLRGDGHVRPAGLLIPATSDPS